MIVSSQFGRPKLANQSSGWMTAEFFIKLYSQMYKKHQDEHSHTLVAKTSSLNFFYELPSSVNLLGGSMALNSDIAKRYDTSDMFSLLQDQDSSSPHSGFLPPLDHKFWDSFRNKLRVNATESGVCDMEGYIQFR